MKLSSILAAGTMLAGLAIASAPASAVSTTFTPCPSPLAFSAIPAGFTCNLIITFQASGAITTSGPGGTYDGIEDSLIGVINLTGSTISSFHIANPSIFGFDGDGIDGSTYSGVGPVAGNPDTTGYGGRNGFFTITTGSSGTVNFFGGIAPGASDYFSLEEPISLSALPVITAAPEPATLALLGVALVGAGLVRRRKV